MKAPEKPEQGGDTDLLFQPQTVQGHSAGLTVPKALLSLCSEGCIIPYRLPCSPYPKPLVLKELNLSDTSTITSGVLETCDMSSRI